MLSNAQSAESHPLLPVTLEARLARGIGRIGGYALLGAVAAAWAALLTSSLTDPSFSRVTGGPAQNVLGAPGAATSDLVMQTLGLAAVLVLLAPMFWGLELVLSGKVEKFRVKAAFFPLSVLVLAGALSSLPTYAGWPLRNGLGGILGDVVYSFSAGLLSLVSSPVASVATGLVLFAGGFAALAYSIGLALSDVAASLRRRERPLQFKDAALAWQDGVAAATHGLNGLRERLPSLSPARGKAARSDREDWTELRAEPMFEAVGRLAAASDDGHDGEVTLSIVPIDEPDDDDEIDLDGDGDSFEASRIARKFAPMSAAGEATEPAPPEPVLKFARRGGATRTIVSLGASCTAMTHAATGRGGEAAFKRFSLNLLKRGVTSKPAGDLTQTGLHESARVLEETLADFGIKGEIHDIKPGPVVTLFEFEPARGIKSSRVIGLADDIARSMSALSVRVAVVPGRNAIGIELPNQRREKVLLRELLESDPFRNSTGPLPMALGMSIEGDPVVADLAHMPHLLVAGTTGSGKSVGLNAMVLSLLYKNAPEDCRFIMIDPKMLELSVYNGIPHLLCPVVTEPHEAVAALNWVVAEMEERYKRMAKLGARRIDTFNTKVCEAKRRGTAMARRVQTGFDRTGQAIYESQELDLEPMANIVVVIDEFADLMAVAGKEVEVAVQRIAQKARAAGIHLIMATQRPSVDVITGTIKANFPTRISFKVTSKVDSRTILNEQGAEQLLGHGDMLYAAGSGQTMRVHGPFVSDEEIEAIVQHLRGQGVPRYVAGITEHGMDNEPDVDGDGGDGGRAFYDRAVAIVARDRKASISHLQRRLSIGYNRAADLIERMEQDGFVSPANAVGRREVLMPAAQRAG